VTAPSKSAAAAGSTAIAAPAGATSACRCRWQLFSFSHVSGLLALEMRGGHTFLKRMRSPQKPLAELLARANYLLAERLSAQLKMPGLSATEWRVLAALAERDGLRMGDLAQTVFYRQPTLSKAIDRIERALLVQRRVSPEDRRQVLVVLTKRGRQLAAPLVASTRDREMWVARVLGTAELQKCAAMLKAIIDELKKPIKLQAHGYLAAIARCDA
jgi:MarR family transcriptional regulator, organic hydroperoxide resistance regulator